MGGTFKKRPDEEIKAIRKSQECIFKGVILECVSQGKQKKEKNHAIAKSNFLENVSYRDQVMVFDIEGQNYYKGRGKLEKRNIRNANTYPVFCGAHDKLVFNEIENGNLFDPNNKKQCYQLAFRSFIFNYSQGEWKEKVKDVITTPLMDRVGSAHHKMELDTLERFKKGYIKENWEDVESVIIELNYKISFVSSFYGAPLYDIRNKYMFSRVDKIFFNIFAGENKSYIVMSYFKDSPKRVKTYCERIQSASDEMIREYFNKAVVLYDCNIAINPLKVNLLNEKELDEFYHTAHYFKKNNRSNRFMFFKVWALKYLKVTYDLFCHIH